MKQVFLFLVIALSIACQPTNSDNSSDTEVVETPTEEVKMKAANKEEKRIQLRYGDQITLYNKYTNTTMMMIYCDKNCKPDQTALGEGNTTNCDCKKGRVCSCKKSYYLGSANGKVYNQYSHFSLTYMSGKSKNFVNWEDFAQIYPHGLSNPFNPEYIKTPTNHTMCLTSVDAINNKTKKMACKRESNGMIISDNATWKITTPRGVTANSGPVYYGDKVAFKVKAGGEWKNFYLYTDNGKHHNTHGWVWAYDAWDGDDGPGWKDQTLWEIRDGNGNIPTDESKPVACGSEYAGNCAMYTTMAALACTGGPAGGDQKCKDAQMSSAYWCCLATCSGKTSDDCPPLPQSSPAKEF